MWNILDWYGQATMGLSPWVQLTLSFVILLLILWHLFSFIKSGHWVFAVVVIILFPGSLPILKKAADILVIIFKFLFVQIIANI